MLKRIMLGFVLVSMLSSSAQVFAEDVVATKQGKKFHKEACMLIKNKEVQKMSDEDAAAKGLKPCGRCFKAMEEKK